PGSLRTHPHGDVERSGGDHRVELADQTVFHEGQLQDVPSQSQSLHRRASNLKQSKKESVRDRNAQVKVNSLQHLHFHLNELVLVKHIVADVGEVFNQWRESLLRSEHTLKVKQLQHLLVHLDARQVEIRQLHGQVQRLVVELKVFLDLDQPVHEDSTHCRRDVALFGAKVRRDAEHEL
ncbi:hypothetical protein EGW08_020707, partial [Elysia chlorotica]